MDATKETTGDKNYFTYQREEPAGGDDVHQWQEQQTQLCGMAVVSWHQYVFQPLTSTLQPIGWVRNQNPSVLNSCADEYQTALPMAGGT
ncbi:hypothetical protein Anapl_00500 [Anas platyrhynchos]|uniref:Uncharacterized protein n=1 Tax=Anas platyrhynchos TaxID=8839 RepID=R0L5U5_ANAPL|nr:hypothetical protein Anapl_00500 [Anas platyrhynchos]